MQSSYSVDLADFIEAEKITPTGGHESYWFGYTLGWIRVVMIGTISVVVVAYCIYLVVVGPELSWRYVLRSALAVVFVLGLLWMRAYPQWKRRFSVAQSKLEHYIYRQYDEMLADATGITLKSPMADAIQLPWTSFSGFREGKRSCSSCSCEHMSECSFQRERCHPSSRMNSASIFLTPLESGDASRPC
jgi:hypothetical protein